MLIRPVSPCMHALVIVAAVSCIALDAFAARADNPFDLAKKPGERTEVWIGEPRAEPRVGDAEAMNSNAKNAAKTGEPPMLRRLRGSLGVLSPKGVDDLRACVRGEYVATPTKEDPGDKRDGGGKGDGKPRRSPTLRLTIRMEGKAGQRDVTVARIASGDYVADVPAIGRAPATQIRLSGEGLDRVLAEIETYWGDYGPAAGPREGGPGEGQAPEPGADDAALAPARTGTFELPHPLVNGRMLMDDKTLERVQGGQRMYVATKRKIESEKIFGREPKGYSARKRPGLLIWMDPTPDGKPPWPLFEAADAMNLVCIGAANAGNNREVVDRFQLAFDGLATAQRLWPIDPRRVYLIGVSGGGKMSSMLLPSFPEVFAGAVPIVGLSWYERLPSGEGGKVWAAEYLKPNGARLKTLLSRRMGVMTGPNDFNYKPILAGVGLFERDKWPVKLFDVPGLGHEFPKPPQIAEALAWVDEPVRKVIEAEDAEGEKLLAAALGGDGEARKAGLLRVVREVPWTGAAWRAVEELAANR